jgi:hypothetical protein
MLPLPLLLLLPLLVSLAHYHCSQQQRLPWLPLRLLCLTMNCCASCCLHQPCWHPVPCRLCCFWLLPRLPAAAPASLHSWQQLSGCCVLPLLSVAVLLLQHPGCLKMLEVATQTHPLQEPAYLLQLLLFLHCWKAGLTRCCCYCFHWMAVAPCSARCTLQQQLWLAAAAAALPSAAAWW